MEANPHVDINKKKKIDSENSKIEDFFFFFVKS